MEPPLGTVRLCTQCGAPYGVPPCREAVDFFIFCPQCDPSAPPGTAQARARLEIAHAALLEEMWLLPDHWQNFQHPMWRRRFR